VPRTRTLGVWLHDVHVADLVERRWNDLRLRYTEEALARWPRNSPIVSCGLPLDTGDAPAGAYCAGVLPEGRALESLAAQAGVAVNDTFDLLARYGRDIAGALVFAEAPPDPTRYAVQPYTADTLGDAVADLEQHPLGSHDDSELSLAGLQDKLLLVDLGDGRWGRPQHGAPSTHILKAEDRRYPGLVAAEAACLALARAAGLTTVTTELAELGGVPSLIVSRFDRRVDGDGTVRRVHQEDLCQALGIDPRGARGRAKYQDAGGPTFRQAAALLDAFAAAPEAELDRLVAIATYTVLIGNADAHGKNLALLHDTAETVTLAPLYDTVPTVLWPKLRAEAAMTVGGQSTLAAVRLEDIVREAATWPHAAARTERVARATVTAVLDAAGGLDDAPAVVAHVRARSAELLGR
jgi:serine/threonine-protein kinase HipA